MDSKRIFAAIILAIILIFSFYPMISVGTLKITIVAKGGLKVTGTIIDLKAYSFNWESISNNKINLTFMNKSETLTVLMPTGNYEKIKFKIVNASINLNGNLTFLKVSQEEYIIESSFIIKSGFETKVIIELKYDEEALTQNKLDLIIKAYSLI
jgi:hypothetical protein